MPGPLVRRVDHQIFELHDLVSGEESHIASDDLIGKVAGRMDSD